MAYCVAVPRGKSVDRMPGYAQLSAVADVRPFNIPGLKIGTYDKLVALSDDLEKVTVTIESTTGRLLKQMLDSRKKAGKDPNAAITIGGGQRLEDYVKDFRWADDKYPVHTPLREMTDEIVQKVTNYANQLALKMTAYQKLTTELGGLNTRSGGTLMTRDIAPPLVGANDFIEEAISSEYCASVFVIVGKQDVKNFEQKMFSGLSSYCTYPTDPMTGRIRALREDGQYALFVVWCCKDSKIPESEDAQGGRPDTLKPMSELVAALRQNRWQVRTEVEYDEAAAAEAQQRQQALTKEQEQEDAKMIKWIDAVFGDAFVAYTHLKALCTFVEAVLRYGLDGGSPDYASYLVTPLPKKEALVRKLLNQMYGEGKSAGDDEQDAMMSRKEYFPYVSETISFFTEE